MMHQDEPCTGVTLDISSGGLGLILEKPLEIGKETTLELFHQKIRIEGTIISLSRIGKDRYQVGVCFKDIEPGLVDGMMAVWGYRYAAAARYV